MHQSHIPHAAFCKRNVYMCANVWYKMVHPGIFVWCIVGFVKWVNIGMFSHTEHYNGAIVGEMASQIANFTIVCSTVYSDADERKYQTRRHWLLRAIHRWPVNSPHKGQVTRKLFPFDDVIMICLIQTSNLLLVDAWETKVTVSIYGYHKSLRYISYWISMIIYLIKRTLNSYNAAWNILHDN